MKLSEKKNPWYSPERNGGNLHQCRVIDINQSTLTLIISNSLKLSESNCLAFSGTISSDNVVFCMKFWQKSTLFQLCVIQCQWKINTTIVEVRFQKPSNSTKKSIEDIQLSNFFSLLKVCQISLWPIKFRWVDAMDVAPLFLTRMLFLVLSKRLSFNVFLWNYSRRYFSNHIGTPGLKRCRTN